MGGTDTNPHRTLANLEATDTVATEGCEQIETFGRFFELLADVSERHNLFYQHTDIVNRLRSDLDAWQQRIAEE